MDIEDQTKKKKPFFTKPQKIWSKAHQIRFIQDIFSPK